MRTAQAVAGVAALFIYLIYWNFGTLSPCGVLRETVRQRDGLAATLLGSTVDVASQNGALSPTRCLSLFLSQKQELLSIAPRPAPQSSSLSGLQSLQGLASTSRIARSAALDQAEHAVDECRTMRLSGELPNFAAAVQCSNPRMIQAFSVVSYSYMDLINVLAEKRLALAQKIDSGMLTEDQADVENAKLYLELAVAERRRDTASSR
ncbi:MAG: hypothetical protein WA177_16565 [Xanthobacteraceae bacterium]